MMTNATMRGLLASTALMLCIQPAFAQTSGSGAIEEIVVTASKREEKLRDVPAAISVLSSQALETMGVTSFRDYATLVPGVSQRDFGSPGTGTVIMRGLNTGPQQTTPTTAFYLDETPFTASGYLAAGALLTPEPELSDIERIEVMKGPQGTLYGASSLGGIIKVVSKKPNATAVSGNVKAEGMDVDGGGTGYTVRGSINVPLVTDKLAVRAVAFHRDIAGYTDNIKTGTRNVNDGKADGARIALRAMPTDRLSIDLVAMAQNLKTTGGNAQDNITDTLVPRYGRGQYSAFADLPVDIRYRLASVVLNYDTGAGQVVASGSYAKYKTAIYADYTDSYAPYLGLLGYPAGSALIGTLEPNMKKTTGETRFVSNRFGPVEFVAGVFYTHESNDYNTTLNVLNAAGAALPLPLGSFLKGVLHSTYKEVAGFGNATIYLADDLDVTGGLRYGHNKQHSNSVSTGVLGNGGVPAIFSFSDSSTTYLATLRWRANETISTYLRAASGYRPGGPQTNRTPPAGAQTQIDPDMVWSYEAGIKGSFLDGKLAVNMSVFHTDWTDIQLNTLAGGTVLGSNGGDAKVDGFEIDLQAQPNRNLTIRASAGYTYARITRIDPGVRTYTGADKGDRLPLTPRITASLAADQTFPLTGLLDGSVGGTIRYEGKKPSSYPGAFLNPNINLPAFTTVDLRAGVKYANYSLQLRAENVFDKVGFTSAATNKIVAVQSVPTQASVIRPRAFILSLNADF